MNELELVLIELGKEPIKGGKPTGTNIRYDDEFELVEDELSKQGSMVDRGLVHWDKVIEATSNILSNKSKDLKVSCYLTRALFETKGLGGLQIGLEINYQLLKLFWDDVYPIKNRAKANAYEWMTSKFIPLIEELEPELDSLPTLQGSYDSIQKIEQFLNGQLGSDAPALGKLRRLINDLIERLDHLKINKDDKKKQINSLQKKVENKILTETSSSKNISTTINNKSNDIDPIDSQLSPNIYSHEKKVSSSLINNSISQSTGYITNTISDTNNKKDKNKIIRECHETLRNLSIWSINQSLDSPSAYAMNRFSTWMGISQLPMHSDNVTPLKPVPKDKLTIYTDLFNNKKYQELIPQVEQSFSKSPFWLDAHRLVSVSLEALGMNEASMLVKGHLALFIRRFTGLLEMKFSDNTDFADQLTKQWINTEVLSSNDCQSSLSIDSSEVDSAYDEVIKSAREFVKQQKMKEAIKLFQDNISKEGNLRKKIFWKYYLARFCYDNGEHKIAYFLLKEIDGFLLDKSLKYWEPDLEKNVIYLLIQSLKNSSVMELFKPECTSVSEDSSETDELDVTFGKREINCLYSRLCQLDPILALDI